MGKNTVAVFDFDGTITTRDTLIEFIRFAKGNRALFCGFLLHAPLLVAFKLGIYPNWKAKQKIFSYFFKGMKKTDFEQLGREFSNVVDSFLKQSQIEKMEEHLSLGHRVYVITASIEDWVAPWCVKHGVSNVLGTKIEVSQDEVLTGRFLTKNCFGQEKVNRLLEKEPDRNNYFLFAYGDSRGDKEMLAFADKGFLCK